MYVQVFTQYYVIIIITASESSADQASAAREETETVQDADPSSRTGERDLS